MKDLSVGNELNAGQMTRVLFATKGMLTAGEDIQSKQKKLAGTERGNCKYCRLTTRYSVFAYAWVFAFLQILPLKSAMTFYHPLKEHISMSSL